MKKILIALTSLWMTTSAMADQVTPEYTIQGNDTTCQIFIYSPGEKEGLHLAFLTDDDSWHDVGQLCSSDYGPWGKEKKMFTPYVIHANDGTWRALWTVNDNAPCFATAYSEDLVTWRPQDFPRMKERGCKEPIGFAMEDGTFDIYFKTSQGKRYVHASHDFRTFEEAEEPSTIEDIAWLRDTATVSGKVYQGNTFDVPKIHLDYIRHYFDVLAEDAHMSKESFDDDESRFSQLPSTIEATLQVDMTHQKPISDHLFGVFFEDISYAADGGLYAEMVQNRDFEYTSADHRGWKATTAWQSAHGIEVGTDHPLSENNPHYATLSVDTLWNIGWDGMRIRRGEGYDFSFYARNMDVDKRQIEVALIAKDGTVAASGKIKVVGNAWAKYDLPLWVDPKKKEKALDGVDLSQCRLAVIPLKKGATAVDMVSLFPHDTFFERKNGLRKDLAQAIADLHPKFVRFPGGCMSHGQGLDNIYHWTESIGPLQDRKPAKNIWNYHQTRGLGFYEYFQFCEDIGAEPLPVLAAGVPCQNSAADKDGYAGQQGGIPMKEMPAYCEEILHLIEWANGDPSTNKWAKMRADAGHPAPFNLKYIGIGNEDLVSTVFEERYLMICKAIKEKYPQITVCGTVGPFHEPSADYLEGWAFAKKHHPYIDEVDEHYYESPGWFLHHQDYYDNYDRKGPKVYLGEYAGNSKNKTWNALAEGIYLCNVERNGDIVAMTSYAPLLCHQNHKNWDPDMIYFNQDTLTTTPNYDMQKFFSTHSGDRYVNSTLEADQSVAYRIGTSVVKDSKNGKTYLKVINALPRTLRLKVEGTSLGTVTVPKYSYQVFEL